MLVGINRPPRQSARMPPAHANNSHRPYAWYGPCDRAIRTDPDSSFEAVQLRLSQFGVNRHSKMTRYQRPTVTHLQEGGTGGEVSEILFFLAKSKRPTAQPDLFYADHPRLPFHRCTTKRSFCNQTMWVTLDADFPPSGSSLQAFPHHQHAKQG